MNTLLHDCDLEEDLTALRDRAVRRYPTIHYFGFSRHTHSQSIIAYKTDEIFFGNFRSSLHCGNVVNLPTELFRFTDHRKIISSG